MFIMKKPGPYLWPVAFTLAGDNGAMQEFTFTAQFRQLPQREIDALFEKLKETPPQISDTDIVKQVLIGWRDVQDESGQPVPFNNDSLDTLLDYPRARAGIARAYFESVVGKAEKN